MRYPQTIDATGAQGQMYEQPPEPYGPNSPSRLRLLPSWSLLIVGNENRRVYRIQLYQNGTRQFKQNPAQGKWCGLGQSPGRSTHFAESLRPVVVRQVTSITYVLSADA